MKRLILASLAMAALAGCSKESEVDTTITVATSKTPIEFTTYAGSATTKGNPVDSNAEFANTNGGTFEVTAYVTKAGASAAKYFDWSTVTYDKTATPASWTNSDKMYWPSYDTSISFAAVYNNLGLTATSELTDLSYTSAGLSFGYTVPGERGATGKDITDQKDILYAMTTQAYEVPKVTSGVASPDAAVNLNFKHALSQIAFTATKDDDITVEVSSITLCNIKNSGTFSATAVTDEVANDINANGDVESDDVNKDNFGSWTLGSTYKHYNASLLTDSGEKFITVAAGSNATALTDVTATVVADDASAVAGTDNALILMPQALTAWDPTDTDNKASTIGSTLAVTPSGGKLTYLAIFCKISHTPASGSADNAEIVNGYLYVPFTTTGLSTDDAWKPGYKYTYNLHFGGGYTDSTPGPNPEDPNKPEPGKDPIPEPGKVPDPDDVIETLRPIVYTVSVDNWIPATPTPDVPMEPNN